MLDVRTDLKKNRLYVTLSGTAADAEAKAMSYKVVTAAKMLKPGFGIINDLSRFGVVSPVLQQELAGVQKTLAQMGMGRAIRVVGQAAMASLQFTKTAQAAGYMADIAASVADAEKMLDAK